jgi:hypothetical protein
VFPLTSPVPRSGPGNRRQPGTQVSASSASLPNGNSRALKRLQPRAAYRLMVKAPIASVLWKRAPLEEARSANLTARPLPEKLGDVEYFDRIGDRIFGLWRDTNFDEPELPPIAERVLADDPAHLQVPPLGPLRWIQGRASIPPQLDYHGLFGQPPLTVYRCGQLAIDVYYWMDGTTSIHQHAFSGAFQVLSGSSIHTEYEFTSDERINSLMQLGKVSYRASECLEVGATRQIRSGNQFIHALFHLDRPSVTVVVRCVEESDAHPQFFYQRPHVAIDFGPRPDVLITRQLQALKVLKEVEPSSFEAMVSAVACEADFFTFFLLMREYTLLQGDLAATAERLEMGRKRHGARVDLLKPVFREVLRQDTIISSRRQVRNKDHRFFLALLANATSRTMLLKLVAQRYPERDPIDLVIEWLRELVAAKSKVPETDANWLGLPLDDEMLLFIAPVLRGHEAHDIRAQLLANGYDAKGIDGKIAAFATVISSHLLSILFT